MEGHNIFCYHDDAALYLVVCGIDNRFLNDVKCVVGNFKQTNAYRDWSGCWHIVKVVSPVYASRSFSVLPQKAVFQSLSDLHNRCNCRVCSTVHTLP